MMSQHEYARHAWKYAVCICIKSTEGSEHEALLNAERDPSPMNLRAALAVGFGKPWAPLFESALIEIGIAAAEDIVGGSK